MLDAMELMTGRRPTGQMEQLERLSRCISLDDKSYYHRRNFVASTGLDGCPIIAQSPESRMDAGSHDVISKVIHERCA